MGRIFLSHSSHDNLAAIAIRNWLEAKGWDDVFLDLDPERGIAAGERWERRLYEAANRCEAVLFLISRSWLASEWCFREYDLAVKLNKRIFGLLIEDMPIAALPARISGTWQVVNLAEGEDHRSFRAVQPDGVEGHVTFSAGGLRRLKAGLERAGLDPRFFAWPPAAEPQRQPYRGLLPLEAEDAGIFFGREAPIIAALDQLRGLADAAPPRFLTILGASGSGKSSFLRAGLLPRLARDDRHFLTLPPIRPERQVISGDTGLLRALETAFRERSIMHTRATLRAAIGRGAPALLSLLAELAGNAALPEAETGTAAIREARLSIVLPIDQGEELFASAGREEASRFLPMLRDLLLATELPLIVLMTIRSDAFDSLQGEASLAEVPSVPFNLPPLPRGAYQLVIEGPAKRLEGSEQPLRIEPALTAALLNDIDEGGAKDALPLLAFTLERLYVEHGGDGDLRLSEYRDLGGIRGSIEAAVERALAAADRNPEIPRERVARLALLRRALIPWLAGIDPDTGSARRLVAIFSEIPKESVPLVRLLVSERLLATDVSATGEETVEPAHEALLRQWGLLQGWLEEDRAALSSLESLQRSARDWAKNKRDAAWLAHQGRRLEDAEALRAREDLSPKLEPADFDYLRAARMAETARRDRLEQLLRRAQIGAFTALCLTFVAMGVGAFGWNKDREAKRLMKEVGQEKEKVIEQERNAKARLREAQIAESRFLAREAEKAISEHSMVRAIGLALAALPADGSLGDDADRPMVAESVAAVANISRANSSRLFLHHDRAAINAVFSPDGSRIATMSGDNVILWDTASGAALSKPIYAGSAISSVDFSPDAKHIVTVSSDGKARLWDGTTGAVVAGPLNHGDGLLGAAFSQDGNRLTTSSEDMLRFWDITTGGSLGAQAMRHGIYLSDGLFSPSGERVWRSGEEASHSWNRALGTMTSHEADMASIVYSPDGNRFLIERIDNTLNLYDVLKEEFVGEPMVHDGMINSIKFSPDSRRFVTASDDGKARLWDGTTGAAIGAPMEHAKEVTAAVFSPDGQRIATASNDGTVQMWDGMTAAGLGIVMSDEDGLEGVGFSPDGNSIMTVSGYGMVQLSGVRALMRHRKEIKSVAFSPDGTRIVTISEDETARLWSGMTGAPLGDPIPVELPALGVHFSSDGERILAASDKRTVRLWDGKTGAMLGEPMRHPRFLRSIAFSHDGTHIVTASRDAVHLWNGATGAALGEPLRPAEKVRSAALSPDGTRIITMSDDNVVRLWDLATRSALGEPMLHGDRVDLAVFSPDGRRIMTASRDGITRLWDGATGVVSGAPLQNSGRLKSAAFSPDGERIVTLSRGGRVRFWDSATSMAIDSPFSNLRNIDSIALSRDGVRVVITSDKTAHVLDTASGAASGEPMRHENSLTGAIFSPDGTRILTTLKNGSARIWDMQLPVQTMLAHARASQFRPLTDRERKVVYLAPVQQGSVSELTNTEAHCNGLALQTAEWFEPEKAIATCENAVEEQPAKPRLRYLLGKALSKSGRYAEARGAFHIAMEDGYGPAVNDLSIAIWNGEGGPVDKAKAVTLWQQAAAMGDPGSHERLGWVAELGRDGSTPDLPKALYHYAVAVKLLEAAGDESESVAPRYRRASLARILDPYVVAAKWREAMAFKAAR